MAITPHSNPRNNEDGFTTSFSRVAEYCEESTEEIKKETKANHFRGEELMAERLGKLRVALVGKTIHWQLRIDYIGEDSITVHASHGHTSQIILRDIHGIPGPTDIHETFVYCQFDNGTTKDGWGEHPATIIKNIPRQKIREFSVGGTAKITGHVEDVSQKLAPFFIKISDTKLE